MDRTSPLRKRREIRTVLKDVKIEIGSGLFMEEKNTKKLEF